MSADSVALAVMISDVVAPGGDDIATAAVDLVIALGWGQFGDECRRWAGAPRRLGVHAGDTVPTVLPNLAAHVASLGCRWE